MTSDFYFTAISWFPGNVRVKPHSKHSAPTPSPYNSSAYVIYEWSSSPTHYCKVWGWSCWSAKKSKKSWWPSIPCWRHQRRWKVQKSLGANSNWLHLYLSFCFSFLFGLNLDIGGCGGPMVPMPPPRFRHPWASSTTAAEAAVGEDS